MAIGIRRQRGQYYYLLAAQPDLNWRNPAVRSAIYEVMRYWFRRGVDGFRVDAVWHLIKDGEFRDNPLNAGFRATDPPHHRLVPLYTVDRPEVHDLIAEMRRVADESPDRLLIGEIYLPVERLVAYYCRDLSGVHLPFNFSLLSASWCAPAIARLIGEYEAALPVGGWPNWVLGNHDRAARAPSGEDCGNAVAHSPGPPRQSIMRLFPVFAGWRSWPMSAMPTWCSSSARSGSHPHARP